MWYVVDSFIPQEVIRRMSRKMESLANLFSFTLPLPISAFKLFTSWQQMGNRMKFFSMAWWEYIFQTQHERVQSTVLNVINKEAWNLLSIFLVTVIELPRTVGETLQ